MFHNHWPILKGSRTFVMITTEIYIKLKTDGWPYWKLMVGLILKIAFFIDFGREQGNITEPPVPDLIFQMEIIISNSLWMTYE